MLTRRRLLVVGLAAAGASVWRLRPTIADTPEKVFAAFCDRILPAHGSNPGAVALGIDVEVFDTINRSKSRQRYLMEFVEELKALRFPKLSKDQQDATLKRILDEPADNKIRGRLRFFMDQITLSYYAHPGAWAAVNYQQPQPGGYPDYARCPINSAHT